MRAVEQLRQDPSDPLALVPGTFVSGVVRGGVPLDRLVLPRRAVRDGRVLRVGANAEGVPTIETLPVEIAWTFEANLPEFGVPDTQWVVLGDSTAESLGEGGLVLLDGSRAVADGTTIRPVRADGTEPTATARVAGSGSTGS